MSIESIDNIKISNLSVKSSLNKIKASDFKEYSFGKESEFNAKGLLAGIDALSKDISALTKAHAKFLKRSSSQEREKIDDLMHYLSEALENEDLALACDNLDLLKPLIRNIDIRHSNERLESFDEQIDALQRSASNLNELIKEAEEKNGRFIELEENMTQVKARLEEKVTDYESALEDVNILISRSKSMSEKIAQIETSSSSTLEEIEQHHSTAINQSQVIENFVKKIAQRETQLEDQEEKTRNYNTKLEKYTAERSKALDEATTLINSAKTALEFKTAESLSAAFSAKLDEAKADKSTIFWAFTALVFIISAVFLGAWSLKIHAASDSISLLLGRLSLVPVLLVAAVFSASQYVKNRNIIEDYAYKSVLAKSLVGFSEQLSDASSKGEIHSHFVKSLLAQIHNDPLHKQSTKTQKHFDNEALLSSINNIFDRKLNQRSGESSPNVEKTSPN